MTLTGFRDQFPVLRERVWLDTSAAAPAATPVVQALRAALDEWENGSWSWVEWESRGYATRAQMAELIGAPETSIALATSLSQAAAIVAHSLPPGRVVVGEGEFRSNLFPWLQLQRHGYDVVEVPESHGVPSTEALLDAISPGTGLVAVSEVLTATGSRIDLEAVCNRAREVGARSFVNLTQSLGVLGFDIARADADYVAVHGYKWLLCPRGCAWLYVRPDRLADLEPLAPSWKSSADPYREYFGGPLDYASETRRLDASLSQLPWIGANAALRMLLELDVGEVEQQALRLADAFRAGAAERGLPPIEVVRPSHIVVVEVEVEDPDAVSRGLLEQHVAASVRGNRLRVGFHGFNDTDDVHAVLTALPQRGRVH
jgi:selenocysteine lyase/cysteine desulfurase